MYTQFKFNTWIWITRNVGIFCVPVSAIRILWRVGGGRIAYSSIWIHISFDCIPFHIPCQTFIISKNHLIFPSQNVNRIVYSRCEQDHRPCTTWLASSSSSVYDVVIIMMISSAVYNAIMMMMMMNIIILVLWLSCNVEQLGLLFKWAMSINSTLYLLDINQPPISLGPRTPLSCKLLILPFASTADLPLVRQNAFHMILNSTLVWTLQLLPQDVQK